MSNIAAALPNTIIPVGPDTAGPASNLYPGKGISNHGETSNLAAEQTRGYRSEEQSTVENQSNNDTDIGNQVNEGKGENFQEVLQRQLSEESDQKDGTSDNEKTESNKTDNAGEDKSSDQTDVILPGLLEARSQVLTTALTVKGKNKTGSTGVDNEKTTLTNNPGTKTVPQQKIVSVSSQRTGESKSMPEQTSEQISGIVNEQIKNTEGVNTKDGKNLTLAVPQGKTTEAKINNENQAAVVDPNPGNVKPVVSNDNQAAVVEPNPGNEKLIVPNENSAIKNNDQTQPSPQKIVPNDVPKPTASQIIEKPKPVAINEKINIENMKPSTEEKSLTADDIKPSQITEKLNNIQTDSAGKKQNTAAGNDNQVALNDNKTTSQKIDTDDINISYTSAQNDSIAVNSAIKASSVLAESVNGPQNISSVANASNTTAPNPVGNMNVTGNISASTPSEQIIQSLKNNPVVPDRQINITLNPPELGRIRITFQQTDGEITGLLEVERAQARYDVEKSLPQIVTSLQQSGVQVQRINVVQNEQGQGQSGQSKDSFAGDFEGTGKQEFSGETNDNKSDGSKPGLSGSTLGGDFQQAKQNVVNEISDDAISAYA